MLLELPEDTILAIAATATERERAITFINDVMREHYGGEAPPTSGMILTALFQGQIVGTIAMNTTLDDAPFPIEENYTFAQSPFQEGRGHIMQGSRWTATKRGISGALVLGACLIAQAHNKRYMLLEAKPDRAERLAMLGFLCEPLEGAVLNNEYLLQTLGEAGMPYYRALPFPRPYLLDMQDAARGAW